MQDKLLRSRNAYNKLNKQNKKKKQADGGEEIDDFENIVKSETAAASM